MTPIDRHLSELAARAGVTIEYADLSGRDGEYLHARRLIRLRTGMRSRLHRSVLAHELGHAAFADVPSRFAPVNAKQERRAEAWAARVLIDLEAYRELEDIHHGHAGAIAVDLGVMRSTVEAFRSLLLRMGDSVYLEPREGPGQWRSRAPVRD